MRPNILSSAILALTTALAAIVPMATCFVVVPPQQQQQQQQAAAPRSMQLFLSSRSSSRIEGNQREPSEEELQIMDEMITKLAHAKMYELPNAVQSAYRVVSSPQFFLRIAELASQETDDVEKEKLAALAENLVSTLEAVVSTAQDKMQEIAVSVETVVKAAAEPDSGEFLVPLLPERITAMRDAMDALDGPALEGDAFLSTVDAWMNKSHQDGMDGMVGILQKVLQMYAGRKILEVRKQQQAEAGSSASLMDELLQTDSDAWDATIREGLSNCSAEELTTEIQRDMESIVLSLESGSMAQQVQAEYLQEMLKRVEVVQ